MNLVNTSWMTEAACKDAETEDFFTEPVKTMSKRYCDHCVVKGECLNFALAAKLYTVGVFGGTNADQRRKMLGK